MILATEEGGRDKSTREDAIDQAKHYKTSEIKYERPYKDECAANENEDALHQYWITSEIGPHLRLVAGGGRV